MNFKNFRSIGLRKLGFPIEILGTTFFKNITLQQDMIHKNNVSHIIKNALRIY